MRLLWTGLGPQTFLPSPDYLSLALSSPLSSASLPTELSQGAFGSQGRLRRLLRCWPGRCCLRRGALWGLLVAQHPQNVGDGLLLVQALFVSCGALSVLPLEDGKHALDIRFYSATLLVEPTDPSSLSSLPNVKELQLHAGTSLPGSSSELSHRHANRQHSRAASELATEEPESLFTFGGSSFESLLQLPRNSAVLSSFTVARDRLL